MNIKKCVIFVKKAKLIPNSPIITRDPLHGTCTGSCSAKFRAGDPGGEAPQQRTWIFGAADLQMWSGMVSRKGHDFANDWAPRSVVTENDWFQSHSLIIHWRPMNCETE